MVAAHRFSESVCVSTAHQRQQGETIIATPTTSATSTASGADRPEPVCSGRPSARSEPKAATGAAFDEGRHGRQGVMHLVAHACRKASPAPAQSLPRLIEPLTPRELEVLDLVCDGDSNLEISERLGIGLSTVKYHVFQIYGKLGVARRTQAVAIGIHLKLVQPAWLFDSPAGTAAIGIS